MDEKQKYLKMWHEACIKASDAMKSGDIDLADKFIQEMEDCYERYKEIVNDEDATMNMNFTNLNATFESVLPKLL